MRCCCANCGWLSVNPSGAMFCGYSDKRTWEDESCMAWKDKDEPQTNADRIRAMSDEELARELCEVETGVKTYGMGVYSHWLDWLKSPVEVDK